MKKVTVNEYYRIIDESINAIVVLSFDEKLVVYYNNSAKEIFSQRIDVGMSINELYLNKDIMFDLDGLKKVKEGTIEKIYYEYNKKYLRLYNKLIMWEGEECIIQYVTDITADEDRKLLNEQLTSLMDNLPVGLCLFRYNSSGDILPLRISKMAELYLGITEDRVINFWHDIEDLRIHPDDKGRLISDGVKTLRLEPHVLDGVYRFLIGKNNTYKYVRVTAKGKTNFDGNYDFYASFLDVDKQYKYEESLIISKRNLDIALATADMNYWEYDFINDVAINVRMHGKLKNLNYSMTNWPETIIEDRTVHEEDADLYRQKFHEIKNGIRDSVNFNARIMDGDGNYIWRNIIANVVKRELDAGYAVCFSVNIDKEKNQIEELYENERLNNLRLNEMLINMEKANKVKTEFLARMSHDMRTPLGAIISLANFGREESFDKRCVEYYREIGDSANYLLALMNDVLEMQKLEMGNIELQLEILELIDLTKEISVIISNLAEKKGVKFTVTNQECLLEKYCYLDKIRTKQILINVLNNGIKYTPKGGKLDWKVDIIQHEKQIEMVNTIKDNGVGISEEFQQVMFEPFTKEKNKQSKSEEGTGLGLAITKRLVESMDGYIEVCSKQNEGTEFKIRIKFDRVPIGIAREHLKNKDKKEFTENSLKGMKVLLCEDMDINARIITKMLDKLGLKTEIAENGEEGVKLIKDNYYDAVLMDIRMPVMDGLEAARRIRSFNRDVPIIAISANAFREDIEKSIDAGMNAHLAKPIDTEELYKTLTHFMKK